MTHGEARAQGPVNGGLAAARVSGARRGSVARLRALRGRVPDRPPGDARPRAVVATTGGLHQLLGVRPRLSSGSELNENAKRRLYTIILLWRSTDAHFAQNVHPWRMT